MTFLWAYFLFSGACVGGGGGGGGGGGWGGGSLLSEGILRLRNFICIQECCMTNSLNIMKWDTKHHSFNGHGHHKSLNCVNQK